MRPGDELVGDANMVFDQSMRLPAEPEAVWPWLLVLGKRRAGWYLPRRLERLLPAGRRAAWSIDPAFTSLAVGDRVPDYGGSDAWLEVAALDPPHALVYRSERSGRPFSWTLTLTGDDAGRCELALRFRGQIRSRGLTRAAILFGGGLFDQVTGELMMRGLRERLLTAR